MARGGALAGAALALCSCDDIGSGSQRSLQPIPPETLAMMEQAGVTKESPTLIRTYKKEAEFQIWKQRPDGRYVYLKTYPMCRWSGQLGPKAREGDRQVPEGFYTITPGQMNPNSAYYLSFNVGYPNALDRALGHSGGSIMVHGACSSAGCFSMTDRQIAEIYAIARTSFNSGQRSIQMQSYPFKMTAENLAKHRLDPNIGFWKQLKEGSDHFEVAEREPTVGVCGRRYVFDAAPAGGVHSLDPGAPCPQLKRDPQIESLVAQKVAQDDAKVAELVAGGAKPVRVVYQDGGQHADFYGRVAEVSRPDALAAAPIEIALEEKAAKSGGKLVKSPVLAMVAAKAAAKAKAETAVASAAVPMQSVAKAAPEPAAEPNRLGAIAGAATSSINDLLGLHKEESPIVASAATEGAKASETAKTEAAKTSDVGAKMPTPPVKKVANGPRRPAEKKPQAVLGRERHAAIVASPGIASATLRSSAAQ
jgi:murein L,D-transpeptidase YafK